MRGEGGGEVEEGGEEGGGGRTRRARLHETMYINGAAKASAMLAARCCDPFKKWEVGEGEGGGDYTPLLKTRSGAAPKSDLLLRVIYF